MKQLSLLLSLLVALMLFNACGTASEMESSQGCKETETPANVSSEDNTTSSSIQLPEVDELLEEAFKKEDSNVEHISLVAITVDVEGIYPDFTAAPAIHEVTLMLPDGWTIQPKQEPIQSKRIFDHFISEDSQAAFYVYDEQGNRCGVLGLDKYSDIEDGVFNFYYGNNLHFADDNPK